MSYNGYFNLQKDKYKVNIGNKKALIIFIDGKNITKNNYVNFYNLDNGSFSRAMFNTCLLFSKKFKCQVVFSSDEASFIIKNPDNFIQEYKSNAFDICSVFSQEFFSEFNKIHKGETIFFHCKLFCIPKEKIDAFISYQFRGSQNILSRYFIKKHPKYDYLKGCKLDFVLEELNKSVEYIALCSFLKYGALFDSGKILDMKKYVTNKEFVELKIEDIFFDLKTKKITKYKKADSNLDF